MLVSASNRERSYGEAFITIKKTETEVFLVVKRLKLRGKGYITDSIQTSQKF